MRIFNCIFLTFFVFQILPINLTRAAPSIINDSVAHEPSSLHLLDLLNKRLATVEGNISTLMELVSYPIPDFELPETRCYVLYTFEEGGRGLYANHLKARLDCTKEKLNAIQEAYSTVEDLDKRSDRDKRILAMLRRFVSESLIQIKAIDDQLYRVFHHQRDYNYEFEPGNRLVLMPVMFDADEKNTVLRGRTTDISQEWISFFKNPVGMSIHLYVSDLKITKPVDVFWDGPMFEIHIPTESLDFSAFSYQEKERDGREVTLYEWPASVEVSVAFCRPIIPNLFLTKCISSNTANWYLPFIVLGSVGVK